MLCATINNTQTKMKTKKYLIIILTGFLFFWGCEEFFRRKIGGFAGSYPFVEYWDIKASEQEIIDAIKELNKTNLNFRPPNNVEFISTRDTSNEQDYWLYIDLYYPDTKEIVHTWTRPDFDPSVTTFAFVSLSSLNNPTEHRLINSDFWYIANKRQINKFKRTFVDKIQEQIDKKRKSGTRGWQNGGRCTNLNICTSINISGLLNIRTSNPPLRQAPARKMKLLTILDM